MLMNYKTHCKAAIDSRSHFPIKHPFPIEFGKRFSFFFPFRSPGEMGYTAVKYDLIETCSYLSRNERAKKLCVSVLPTTLWVFGKQK